MRSTTTSPSACSASSTSSKLSLSAGSPHQHRRFHRVPQGDLAADLEQHPTERLNRETAAAPTSWPSSPSATRSSGLLGAVLAEQHDEWTDLRRYIG
jgi:hypothetical protein